MKVVKATEPTGPWGLNATLEHYDGNPPFDRILFDRQPRALSPDRVGLAAYLVFGHLASGRFETPQWHSPGLAQAMAADAQPAWIQTQPVELYAKPLPIGRRSVRVSIEGVHGLEPRMDSTGDPYELRVMRSDLGSGARTTFTSLEVSSNAWLFTTGQGDERRLRVALACAVLFAEDLEADRFLVGPNMPTPAVERVRHLLDAVRLGVDQT